jgi:four helix bundle protein
MYNKTTKEEFQKRLIKFSIDNLKLVEKLKSRHVFWPILDQLIRSSTSVGANIIEAKSSSSRKDYIHFFEIALKSSNETKYWLTIIKETCPFFKLDVVNLDKEVEELSKIIA